MNIALQLVSNAHTKPNIKKKKKLNSNIRNLNLSMNYLNEFSDICFRLIGTDDYFGIMEWMALCSISTCLLLQVTLEDIYI